MSLVFKIDFIVETLLDLQEHLRSKKVSKFNISLSRKEEIEQAKKAIADKILNRAVHPATITIDSIATCGFLEVEAEEIFSHLQELMLI
ncbi:MAG: hypothetical protein ACTSQE_16535 [Candidatus Heimdallarchaeaceae archaeon]